MKYNMEGTFPFGTQNKPKVRWFDSPSKSYGLFTAMQLLLMHNCDGQAFVLNPCLRTSFKAYKEGQKITCKNRLYFVLPDT